MSSISFKIDCNDFINQWEKLYAIKWDEVQGKINRVIKDAIETVSRYDYFQFKNRLFINDFSFQRKTSSRNGAECTVSSNVWSRHNVEMGL